MAPNKLSHMLERLVISDFYRKRYFSSQKCDYLQEGEFERFQLEKDHKDLEKIS